MTDTWNTCPSCGSKWRDDQATPGILHRTRLCSTCALVGRWVKFAHQPEGPGHLVTRATEKGMVELEDMVGQFAPHLFVLA